jgi:cobalt-zinc-cadmium efflux system membrane fusion protein
MKGNTNQWRLKTTFQILALALLSLELTGCSAIAGLLPPEHPLHPSHHVALVTDPIGLSKAQQHRIGITTEKVVMKTLPIVTEATGTVKANTNLTTPVISLTPGRVEEVLVQPGDQVKSGQVLARIRSDEIARIQTELLSALLELKTEKHHAALKVQLAQKVFDRKAKLLEEMIAAKADVDQAESDLLQAKEEVTATAEKEDTLVESAKERMRLFGASPAVIDGVVKSRHIKLVFDLTAPRSGIITERDCDPGELVEGGKALFSVSDLSRVWLVANVLENNLRFVKKGLPVKVMVDSLPDESFPGVLDFVDSKVDAQTRTLSVRATIDNSSFRLKPEMFARLSMQVGSTTALMVPEGSVQKVGEASLVYVDGPGDTFLEKKVKTGQTAAGFVEVVSGLHQNDKVVVNGSLQLLGQSLQRMTE